MTTDPLEDFMNTGEAPELERCDHCDRWVESGEGGRLGSDVLCAHCWFSHPVVVGELAAALRADERRGK